MNKNLISKQRYNKAWQQYVKAKKRRAEAGWEWDKAKLQYGAINPRQRQGKPSRKYGEAKRKYNKAKQEWHIAIQDWDEARRQYDKSKSKG